MLGTNKYFSNLKNDLFEDETTEFSINTETRNIINNISAKSKNTKNNFFENSFTKLNKEIKNDLNLLKNKDNDYFGNNHREVKEEDLYEDNGGTAIMIKVDNKLIIGADTRLNAEYNIYTRKVQKIYKVGDYYLTTVGFHADGYNIFLKLNYEISQYEQYTKMKLSNLARFLHHVLYNNRFFPLYSYCCLGGFEDGEAKIFTFDCVGSYQESECRVDGTGTKMIQPLLDSWINGKNFNNYKGISFEDAVGLIKKAFDSAAESDVKTGDHLEVIVLDQEKEHREVIDLRKD
ncbi:PRE7 [Ecytonucleospora hepatopenaei]|uniref:PRE7 n=1 Tax=Ecytonucleospora hepatopenaei TaxID=646526 RepID=A0A1W0E562_9MICR|nr:PRE7 [Ecytonucleospora hepatopenaei]